MVQYNTVFDANLYCSSYRLSSQLKTVEMSFARFADRLTSGTIGTHSKYILFHTVSSTNKYHVHYENNKIYDYAPLKL